MNPDVSPRAHPLHPEEGQPGGLWILKYFVCIVPVSFGNLSEIHFAEGDQIVEKLPVTSRGKSQ